jgi:hypothetical protein
MVELKKIKTDGDGRGGKFGGERVESHINVTVSKDQHTIKALRPTGYLLISFPSINIAPAAQGFVVHSRDELNGG